MGYGKEKLGVEMEIGLGGLGTADINPAKYILQKVDYLPPCKRKLNQYQSLNASFLTLTSRSMLRFVSKSFKSIFAPASKKLLNFSITSDKLRMLIYGKSEGIDFSPYLFGKDALLLLAKEIL